MRKLLGSVCLALIGAAPVAHAEIRSGKPVFSCSFGTKQATVTGVPPALTYRFGIAGNAEMTVVGSLEARNVFQKEETFAHSSNKQLRFSNGPFDYVLYRRFDTGGGNPSQAQDVDGLLVLKDGKLLAKLKCKAGPGFSDAELSAVAQDQAFDLADFM